MRTNAKSLQRLFAPRSIAVVGASTSPDKAGHQFLRNLATFPGPVYAVNPTATEILGRRYLQVARPPSANPSISSRCAFPPPPALRRCVRRQPAAPVPR